jgi:hypothetical protein
MNRVARQSRNGQSGSAFEALVVPPAQIAKAAARYGDTLGGAGRSRGVDDVGELVVGGRFGFHGLCALQRDGGGTDGEEAIVLLQAGRERIRVKDEVGLGILKDERQPRGGVGQIERKIGCAGLVDTEDGDDKLDRPVHEHADPALGAQMALLQHAGDLIGPGMECLVGDGSRSIDNGGMIGIEDVGGVCRLRQGEINLNIHGLAFLGRNQRFIVATCRPTWVCVGAMKPS